MQSDGALMLKVKFVIIKESREEKGRGVATKMSVCFALIAIIPLILAAVIFIFCWTRNWKLTLVSSFNYSRNRRGYRIICLPSNKSPNKWVIFLHYCSIVPFALFFAISCDTLTGHSRVRCHPQHK